MPGRLLNLILVISAHRYLVRQGRVIDLLSVMPQTKSIAVKCTNVAAQAYLTMRLEASAVSGQAMVSDNQDLGFIVADQNDTPITPNDLNSVIPFRLDAAAVANVTLRARLSVLLVKTDRRAV